MTIEWGTVKLRALDPLFALSLGSGNSISLIDAGNTCSVRLAQLRAALLSSSTPEKAIKANSTRYAKSEPKTHQ